MASITAKRYIILKSERYARVLTVKKRNTILVVDDLPDNIEIISRLLEMRGHLVVKTYSGLDALKLIPDLMPDLILLDIMMPKISGIDVCLQLKADEKTKHIPIIFMTALDSTLDKIRGLEAGAVDYITKPLHHQEVITRVETHLELYNHRREIERLREQERRMYETLSEIKDDLIQTASHDLKSPLSTIRMAIHLLEKHGRSDDERGKRYIQMLKDGSGQIQNLINDLLDIAKLETGMEIHLENVHLMSFVQNIVVQYQEKSSQKNLRFSTKLLIAD
ncbi:MAG: hybrid sensor histidine kinase/response regulator, partial [Chloroflexi bacterium]